MCENKYILSEQECFLVIEIANSEKKQYRKVVGFDSLGNGLIEWHFQEMPSIQISLNDIVSDTITNEDLYLQFALESFGCCCEKDEENPVSKLDNGFSHDFTGPLTLNNNSLLSISSSGNTLIDSIDIDVKQGSATYQRGGASTVLDWQGESRSFGLNTNYPLSDGWSLDIPSGGFVVVTWDELP